MILFLLGILELLIGELWFDWNLLFPTLLLLFWYGLFYKPFKLIEFLLVEAVTFPEEAMLFCLFYNSWGIPLTVE